METLVSDSKKNPFPGPRVFTPEEYLIFAGRDLEISELSSLVISHQDIVVRTVPGKSSLVNAGLLHSLEGKGIEYLPRVRSFLPMSTRVVRVGIPVPVGTKVNNTYIFSAIGDLLPEQAGEEWTTLRLSPTLSIEFLEGTMNSVTRQHG